MLANWLVASIEKTNLIAGNNWTTHALDLHAVVRISGGNGIRGKGKCRTTDYQI